MSTFYENSPTSCFEIPVPYGQHTTERKTSEEVNRQYHGVD